MFKLNVKSDLIQKSAHASYRLAMRICDSDVEDYITEDAMENLAEAWYESKENFIDLFGGKTTIEETIELPLETCRVQELIRGFFEKLAQGNFTYKREAYSLKRVRPFDIKRDAILGFYKTLIYTQDAILFAGSIMRMTHFMKHCTDVSKFKGLPRSGAVTSHFYFFFFFYVVPGQNPTTK